ncbi:dihydrolipoamide acetyltransferase family protein [Nonomuraea longicatena]|uniref:Dihydrolipoamide acetyltransferase component of pyruvate dehydrogenase complex n=1 Tax=Nonomuraea longicatena TaxID=83682 RepID=A0ABN1RBQ6_9ACTN
MTSHSFTLPDLGEGLTEAEIVRWLVGVGDRVRVDQPVVEVETAKAAVEVPTPYAGVVTAQPVAEGDVVTVGSILIVIGDPDDVKDPANAEGTGGAGGHGDRDGLGPEAARYVEEERAGSGNVLVGYGVSTAKRRHRIPRRPTGLSTGPAPSASPPPSVSPSPSPPAPSTAGRPLVVSPVVRRLARENGVDLAALPGSGPGGLITRSDVTAAMTAQTTETAAPQRPAVPAGAPQSGGGYPRPVRERIALRGVRKAAAEVFTRSRREIPDATTWVDVDATELMRLRRELAEPVGVLALVARFVLAGLARHPVLNSRVEASGEVVVFDGVNLGIAAQTPGGLVVPVLKDAHLLSAAELHDALGRLTTTAREGGLTPSDLTGGTFTLNNYGVFGVDGSTPIVNHPETAMLGLGRILDRPWVVDGAVTARKIAQLSFAFDHRVCDGGTAASFLRFVADCVEDPRQALVSI